MNKPIRCKEYGASLFFIEENKAIIERLKEYFPFRWKEMLALSVFRLLYQSPLKDMELHYHDSYLSEVFPELFLSKNRLHQILEDVGQDRKSIAEFSRSFVCGNENLLIDLEIPKQTRDLIETLGLHIT